MSFNTQNTGYPYFNYENPMAPFFFPQSNLFLPNAIFPPTPPLIPRPEVFQPPPPSVYCPPPLPPQPPPTTVYHKGHQPPAVFHSSPHPPPHRPLSTPIQRPQHSLTSPIHRPSPASGTRNGRTVNRKQAIRDLLIQFADGDPWINHRTGRYYDPKKLEGREHRRVVLPQDVEKFCTDMEKALPAGDDLSDKVTLFTLIHQMVHQAVEFTPYDGIPTPFGFLRLVHLLFALVERWDLLNVVSAAKNISSHDRNVISINGLNYLIDKHTRYWEDVVKKCGTKKSFLEHVNPSHIMFIAKDIDCEWNEHVKKRLEASLPQNKEKPKIVETMKRPLPPPTLPKPKSPKEKVTPRSTVPKAPAPTHRTRPSPSVRLSPSLLKSPKEKVTPRSTVPKAPAPTHRTQPSPSERPSPLFRDISNASSCLIEDRFIEILRKKFTSPATFNFERWEQNLYAKYQSPPKNFFSACLNYEIVSRKRIKLLKGLFNSVDFLGVEEILKGYTRSDYSYKLEKLEFIVAVMDTWHILELIDCSKDEALGLADKFFACLKQIKMSNVPLSLLLRVQEKWTKQVTAPEMPTWNERFLESPDDDDESASHSLPTHLEAELPTYITQVPTTPSHGRPDPPLTFPPSEDLLKSSSIVQDRFVTILKKHHGNSKAANSFDIQFQSWERSLTSVDKLPPRKFLIACHKYQIFYGKRIELLHRILSSISITITKSKKIQEEVCKISMLQFIVVVIDIWNVLTLRYSKEDAQGVADHFLDCFKLVEGAIAMQEDHSANALLQRVKDRWKLQEMASHFRTWTKNTFKSTSDECGSSEPSRKQKSSRPHPNGVTSSSSSPSQKKRKRIIILDDDSEEDLPSVPVDSLESLSQERPPSSGQQHNEEVVIVVDDDDVASSSLSPTQKKRERSVVLDDDSDNDLTPVPLELPPLEISAVATITTPASHSERRRQISQKIKFLDHVYKYARDRNTPPEDISFMEDDNVILPWRLAVETSGSIEPDIRVEVLSALFDWLLKEAGKENSEIEAQLKVLFITTYLALHWDIIKNREHKTNKTILMEKLWKYFTLVLKNWNKCSSPDSAFHLKLSMLVQKWTDSYLISFRALLKEMQETCVKIKLEEIAGVVGEENTDAEQLKKIYDFIIDMNDVFVESVESNLIHCDIGFCRHLLESNDKDGIEMRKACLWASLGIIPTVKDKRRSTKIAEMVGDFLHLLIKISELADSKNSDKLPLHLLYSWKTAILKVLSETEVEILFHRIDNETLRNDFKALKLPTEKCFQDFYLQKTSELSDINGQ